MVKVLYISYDGMTDPLGQSQVIPCLAGLSGKGLDITILSCEKKDNFSGKRQTIEKILSNSKIKWEPIFYTKKPPVLSTVFDIYKLYQHAIKLHKKNDFKIVHCRSYISALIGTTLKRKLGLKFIFDMRGFWADERVDGKLWNLKSPVYNTIYKFFKRKEVEFLNSSDYTISLTRNAEKEINSWEEVRKPIPIQVIPCCVDLSLFDFNSVQEEAVNKLKSELGISPTDFVLTYIGAIGTWYMLEEMLDFFLRLKGKKADSKFLFITAEDPLIISKALKGKNMPHNDVLIRKADRAEMPNYISLSTASIFFIKPAYSKKASSPTKQGELMSMGVPVICNAGVGDTDEVVKKYKSGLLINQFTVEEYDKVVNDLDRLAGMQKNHIREGAKDFYSLENGVERYYEVYKKVLDHKN